MPGKEESFEQDEEQQLAFARSILKKYDYSAVVPLLKDAKLPLSGRPLTSELFEKSGLNYELMGEIAEYLQLGYVVVLTGAFRMGKTTLGKNWLDKTNGGKLVEFMTSLNIINPDEFDSFFIDEVSEKTVDAQSQAKLLNLIQSGKKIVIAAQLDYLRHFVSTLTAQGVRVKELIVRPATETELAQFISTTLSLSPEDNLVKAITVLSGGSGYVASVICGQLILSAKNQGGGGGQIDPNFGLTAVSESEFKLKDQLDTWHQLRNQIPEDLRDCIPDPLIQYI